MFGFVHKVDKSNIPVCNILGVNIAAINMNWLIKYVTSNIEALKGDYICVANVHAVVMSYVNEKFKKIENEAALAIPDGGPLSALGRKRGYYNMRRTTGPSFMEEMIEIGEGRGYRHFLYGSTQETLDKMKNEIESRYEDVQIVGMYSPPFRKMSEEEDKKIIEMINETSPDFVWVGLGAPKQEIWMYKHKNKIDGLMVGVGAAFDYMAGNIKRAPKWMQSLCLEWLYRLMQDPKRLFSRYMKTNMIFLLNAVILGK